ncbi:hypothetical protein ACFL6K_04110 [Candidatus Latescibacterota bacterium]
MQISPLLPQAGTPFGLTPSRTVFEENIHTMQSETNISYSDNNMIFDLSISSQSTYIESMYTAEGVFENSDSQSNINILSIPAENNISGAEQQSIKMLENAMNKYMEMIANQVENLLREIAELQQRMLDQADPGDDRVLPAANNGSALKGYSIYSQQTLINTLEISGNAPVSDSGYYSSEKTAERIISFALSFFDGGDRQEYAEMVKAAVMKGFDQALGAFGGVLPQESYDTIGIVNSAIDNFAGGGNISMSA